MQPSLDQIDALCTISLNHINIGSVSNIEASAPCSKVHDGRLFLPQEQRWCDVHFFVIPANRLRTEILVRMKQLFLNRTPDSTKVLVLHGMVRQENDVYAFKTPFDAAHKNPLCLCSCVVAERTSGVTLHGLLSNQLLNVPSSLQILLDVAEGMRYLHSRNIIHRMLTTSCIYLTSEGGAKVSNFEYSRAFANVMTNIGIPYYSAPEILAGATSYTEKVDVYSFAMLIVEVVTKKEPYSNVNAPEATILEHVVRKHYRPVFHHTAEWPADLFELMKQCWDVDPEKRPTFDEIVPRLENLNLVERLLNDYSQLSAHAP